MHFFFFSSRRRHTRSKRDWSSDVCSSDLASMAQTMPGVESFDVHDEKRWTANVKIPLGLGGLKMKVAMEKVDEREPEHAVLSIKGQGVGAMMNMQTSFDLSEADDGGTAMKWSADVRIAGPVG